MTASPEQVPDTTLSALNEVPVDEMVARLQSLGVPGPVARRLTAARPFVDVVALCDASDEIIRTLGDAELQAALEAVPPPQAKEADEGTRAAAHTAMAMYRDRFGYPFVTGIETPTAEELLMRVRIRLGNDAAPEWRAAREHLRRHVRARLLRAIPLGA